MPERHEKILALPGACTHNGTFRAGHISPVSQAQSLQQKLKDTQAELAKTEIIGEAAGGAVVITCDGQGKFKSIKLKPEAINPENLAGKYTVLVHKFLQKKDILHSAVKDAMSNFEKSQSLPQKNLNKVI